MIYNVVDMGIISDGSEIITQKLQNLIDECSKNGGGTIYFPTGLYKTGTVFMKDDVIIEFGHKAVIQASENDDDFYPFENLGFETYGDDSNSYYHKSIFCCEEIANFGFIGFGKIHGNRYKRGDIKPIAIKICENITIRDITIENAMDYAIAFLDCEFITIDNVKIINGLADGIDLDNCRFTRISNSYVDSWDDSICFKSSLATGKKSQCENIVICNCIASSSCSCIKFGTESSGTFKNITISNCSLLARPFGHRSWAGLAIESVDGAQVDGISISNISIQNTLCPIFIRLGNRGRGMEDKIPGICKNISIANIVVSKCSYPILISGIPDHYVDNVALDNILIENYKESGIENYVFSDINLVEMEEEYPDPRMFGELPSWAIYCRHSKNINLSNIRFKIMEPQPKCTAVFDDISNCRITDIVVLNYPSLKGWDSCFINNCFKNQSLISSPQA